VGGSGFNIFSRSAATSSTSSASTSSGGFKGAAANYLHPNHFFPHGVRSRQTQPIFGPLPADSVVNRTSLGYLVRSTCVHAWSYLAGSRAGGKKMGNRSLSPSAAAASSSSSSSFSPPSAFDLRSRKIAHMAKAFPDLGKLSTINFLDSLFNEDRTYLGGKDQEGGGSKLQAATTTKRILRERKAGGRFGADDEEAPPPTHPCPPAPTHTQSREEEEGNSSLNNIGSSSSSSSSSSRSSIF